LVVDPFVDVHPYSAKRASRLPTTGSVKTWLAW
jgi:hypothetical protein